MFDTLRVGDGARFTVESKNDLLEGTHEIATEAIRSRQSPSIEARFARNYNAVAIPTISCFTQYILG